MSAVNYRFFTAILSGFLGMGWLLSSGLMVQEPADNTADIISRLNDRRFSTRNAATAELTERGISIVRPLLEKAYELGPETLWRATRIVEAIGLAGDEDTFVKCAAILKTFSSHRQIDQNLATMEMIWKSGQTKRAAEKLKKLGAVVSLTEMDGDQEQFFQGVIFANGIVEEERLSDLEPVDPNAKTPVPVKLAPDEVLRKVDTILASSLTDNYQIAFPTKDKKEQRQTDATRELFLEQQIMRRRVMFANGLMVNNEFGDSVMLGKEWTGTPADFRAVATINDVKTIAFADMELTPDYLEPLQRMNSLVRLRLERVKLDQKALDQLARIKTLGAVELLNAKLTDELFAALTMLVSLNELTVEADAESQLAFWKNVADLPSVSSLVLKRMEIKDEYFETIEKVPSLAAVMLEGCQFNIKKFKEFKQQHPEFTFDFIPRAYLGVRADFAAGNSNNIAPCRIGEVVPGTGSDLAGMKIGDVVKFIAGQEINAFEDLRLVVAQFKPDDVVEVVVDRDGERIPLKIKLGDRSKAQE
jgi:hypothetical protein